MTENFTAELRAISKRLKPGVGGRGRRSTLFRWLHERADGFQRLLDDSRPSWESVAEAMTAHGLFDGAGKAPTAERVRKTWFEVRRAKGWVSLSPLLVQENRTGPPAPAPAYPLVPLATDAEAAPAAVGDIRARLRAKFKPVTIRQKN